MSRIVHDLIADLRLGRIRTVAFVVRGDVRWTLPLYELAIATARRGWSMGIADARYLVRHARARSARGLRIRRTRAVSARLEPEGITFVGSTFADLRPGAVLLDPQGECIEVDRVVTLGESPRITMIDFDGRDDRFQYEAAGSSGETVGTRVDLAAELLLQPFPRGVPQLLVDVPEVSLDRVLGDELRLCSDRGWSCRSRRARRRGARWR